MPFKKNFILALALLIPVSFSAPSKALTTEEKIVIGLAATLVAIPVGIVGYWLYEKYRLAHRTHEEVCSEAEVFIKKTEITYNVFDSILEKITPDLKYLEAKMLHNDVVNKASRQNTYGWPLVRFESNISQAILKLNQHKNWLDERIAIMDNISDILCIEKSKQLVEQIILLSSKLANIHAIIVESVAYQTDRRNYEVAMARMRTQVVYV